jgi:single-strand DNA-binding protein
MYQRLVLVGNLGRDPEMRYTPQGTPVTSLSVATSRRYNTADGQQKQETIWFRVSVWGKQAETVNQYLTKGRKVLVEGYLVGDENGGPRIWTDKEGKARASFEVRAVSVQFLDSKREAGNGPQVANGAPVSGVDMEEPPAGENLPF